MIPPLALLQLVVEPVDMCLDIEGLSAKIHAALQHSPIEGAAYAFRNQRSNRLKVLLWDRSGIWLAQRRLHHGRFIWPQVGDTVFTLDVAQWQWLVSGVDWQRLSPPPLPEYVY